MSTQVLIQSISEIRLPKINLRKICISGLILITAFLVFYIFQISEVTRAGFLLSEQGQEVILLSQQNKNLEIAILQNNSLPDLEAVLKKLNYEKVDKIYYIKSADGQVAVKP